jgi:hypothetical protein
MPNDPAPAAPAVPDPKAPPPGPEGPEGLAALAVPLTRLERTLQVIPRALSSKAHVILLLVLGVYLVVLPLVGVQVSAKAELIGGNYTNVTSDVGACIAAGGTLHLIRQGRRRHRLEQERLRLTAQMHAVLCRAHPDLAAAVGALPLDGSEPAGGPGASPAPLPPQPGGIPQP